MFDTPYDYNYINFIKTESLNKKIKEHTLTFTGKNNIRYIVKAEEFDNLILAIKFFPKNSRYSKNKYNKLTGLFDVQRILSTLLNIINHFFEKNPYYSFVIIGSPLDEENTELTKRYRVYRQILINKFSPLVFAHTHNEEKSVYILLNRHNFQINPSMVNYLENLFTENFKNS